MIDYSTLTDEQAEHFCYAVEEAELHPYLDYSGRGMYGSKCVGVVGSFSQFAKFIARLGSVDMELAEHFSDAVSQDSMGLDSIFYWTSLESVEGLKELFT